MRTPGHDSELALGFLHGEGIVRDFGREVVRAGMRSESPVCNVVVVELQPHVQFEESRLQRNFYTTSSCGICSKASLEALSMSGCRSLAGVGSGFSPPSLFRLTEQLENAQSVFSTTGGLHAAGLFDAAGRLFCLREDVGRHNAVDKVVGTQLEAGKLPLHDCLLLVSGRTSFEILQKALMAGIPTVAGVSAPSSLAVETAHQYGMTLIGFLRGQRFNIYTHPQRVYGAAAGYIEPLVPGPGGGGGGR
jgi:FdhD protein